MCEEKRDKIPLIKSGNAVNECVMNKFSNENQGNFGLFNLSDRCFKGFFEHENYYYRHRRGNRFWENFTG